MIDRLRELLEIADTPTGLRWKVSRLNKVKAGDTAFTSTIDGYFVGTIDRKRWLAHRVVYALVNGELPPCIDHIDGDRKNNTPSNLRSVTSQQNQHNVKPTVDSKHGKGYRARIRVDGVQLNLGTFPSVQLARAAYLAAKKTHHPTAPERCYA